MKVTVELPEDELSAICQITGIRKKGPAIRKLLADSLLRQRRALTTQKFLTGEWSADLDGFESTRKLDRQTATTLAEQWRV